jgi:predicted TIM-barrel fold metal-dependent hydrolase
MSETMAIYSCDDHLDLSAVPPQLWQARVASEFVARAPRVEERDGARVWVCDGKTIGRSGVASANKEFLRRFSAIGRAGIDDDGYRAGTPELRLQDLDRDGVAASVIYGPLSLGFHIEEPELQSACYAAWNDWAVEEFNAHAPNRLCMLGFLPSHSPDAAAAELERCAAIGHRGVIVSVFEMDLGDPAWDRLWYAAEETGLPVSFHIARGTSSRLSYMVGKWQSAAFATLLPMQLDEPLATMVFSGALERHPRLRIVLAESGVGWLPYFLTRMDMEWEALRDKLDYAPQLAPSELFRRQVYATFEEEPTASDFIPMIGADCCMWASDYPHTDSTFPESRRAIAESLGGLAPGDVHKIVAANCARLYGFADA